MKSATATNQSNTSDPEQEPASHNAQYIMHLGKKLAVLGYALQIVTGIMLVCVLCLGTSATLGAAVACSFLAAVCTLALVSGYVSDRGRLL